MQKKIEAIKDTLDEAKRLPAIKAAAKIAAAEKALEKALSLISEVAHRIEVLEGVTGVGGHYE